MNHSNINFPGNIDHFVYAVPNLEEARDYLENLLGVRPCLGGRHPEYGTHNAQLSLGSEIYLEIMAPDPEINLSERKPLFGSNGFDRARLAAWLIRSRSIGRLLTLVTKAGFQYGRVEFGRRVKPDGSIVSWELTDPSVMVLSGAVPFLIDWKNTPHPARSAPNAGKLVGFKIVHPDPLRVRKALSALSLEIEVDQGDRFQLVARILGAKGEIVLQ